MRCSTALLWQMRLSWPVQSFTTSVSTPASRFLTTMTRKTSCQVMLPYQSAAAQRCMQGERSHAAGKLHFLVIIVIKICCRFSELTIAHNATHWATKTGSVCTSLVPAWRNTCVTVFDVVRLCLLPVCLLTVLRLQLAVYCL